MAEATGAEGLAEAVTDTIREPILVLDDDLGVRRANRAFYETFGSDPDATVGRPLYELGSGEWDVPELRRLLEEILPEDTALEGYEVEADFPDIGARIMELNARRLLASDDREPMILLAIQDVTERRRMERDLRRSNRELEEFAYAASHDLQEPLRMVYSFMELLEERYADELDQDAREFIGYAVDGARRMKRLIDDLLAYSRVGRNRTEIELVDCGEVLEDVLEDLRLRLEESGAEVSRGELPVVRGSRSEITRLLQNLVENAVIHGAREGERPRVHVSSERRGKWQRLTVRDKGPGVPTEQRDRVFEIFQRGAGPGDGSGIGLAMCRKIAEHHRGGIRVESAPGGGAAFHVDLPARTRMAEEGATT